MLKDIIIEGDILICDKDLQGIATINKGDKARYLGHSQIKMLDGVSKDWVFTLLITAPFSSEISQQAAQLKSWIYLKGR